MEDTIGEVRAVNKLLLVRPVTQADRQSRIELLEGTATTTRSYNAFTQFFNGLRAQEMGGIRTSALDKLWQFFPPQSEDLKGKIGNAVDPGDGLIYDGQTVENAKSILKDLHDAWCNMRGSSSCPQPPRLLDMAMICLVLTGMQQQTLLEDFLDHDIVDENLPLDRSQIGKILKAENSKYASVFLSEQYRAVPRKWHEGLHVEIEEEEPLPFMVERTYNHGSYGVVWKVKDSVSGAYYAQKQQLASTEEEYLSARIHLEEEQKRLKTLKHKHIIRLVGSYQRGRLYGLLLEPAATCDLERLIKRYYHSGNVFDAHRGCCTRDWMRRVFLQAFGCLSQGLSYIHNHEIRHKDVKPANILYDEKHRHEESRLLWADFGLAYDFSAAGNSKTKSTKVYSQRYAAPEILAASLGPVTDRSLRFDLDRIVHGDNATVPDALVQSNYNDEENGHGRKTDIFSLGCVFLELLACLFDQKLPMDRQTPKTMREPSRRAREGSEEVRVFSDHIPELIAWAKEVDTKAELSPLLRLAIKMISLHPEDRPVIDGVVRYVAAASRQCFCDSCWVDHANSHEEKQSNGVSQSIDPALPSSPRGSRGNMLERVDSAPRRGSLGVLLERVNSASRPQTKRIFSMGKG